MKTKELADKLERLVALKLEENTLLAEIMELIPPVGGEVAAEALTDPRLPGLLRYRGPEGA